MAMAAMGPASGQFIFQPRAEPRYPASIVTIKAKTSTFAVLLQIIMRKVYHAKKFPASVYSRFFRKQKVTAKNRASTRVMLAPVEEPI